MQTQSSTTTQTRTAPSPSSTALHGCYTYRVVQNFGPAVTITAFWSRGELIDCSDFDPCDMYRLKWPSTQEHYRLELARAQRLGLVDSLEPLVAPKEVICLLQRDLQMYTKVGQLEFLSEALGRVVRSRRCVLVREWGMVQVAVLVKQGGLN